ncbi:MAG: HupE/UreJ family protein [Gammaproteobacteria bacterium]|nr:HupE/UreJ family protein [Gammaproteobacteria bacterium]
MRSALAALLLLAAPAALAHSPIKGLDSFYAGILHPLVVPAHVMAVLVFGILVGQQGVKQLQAAVMGFLAAVGIGIGIAGFYPGTWSELPLLGVVALVGLLVALAKPLPVPLHLVIAVVLGGLLGMDSAQAELAGRAMWASLLGSGVALYLLVLYALVFAEYFSRHAWQRIGLRVIGSWVAAAALLVLALQLSKQA